MRSFFGKISVLLLIICVSSFAAFAIDGKGVVTGSILNVRSGPGIDFSRVDKIPRGTEAPVLKVQGEWVQIRTAKATGWVSADYFDVLSNPKPDEAKPSIQGESLNNKTGVINSSSVNVRKEPSTDSQKVGSFSKGELVNLLKKSGDWYYCKNSNAEGWVAGWLVTINGTGNDSREYYVNGSIVNLRSQPSLSGDIVAKLKMKDKLKVLGQNGDWYQVQTAEGTEGWIAGWLIAKASGEIAIEEKPSGSIYPQNPDTQETGISKAGIKINDQVVVKGNIVNVRQGPGLIYQSFAKVKAGDVLTVIDAENNWLKIKLSDGNIGWIAEWMTMKREKTEEIKREDVKFDENEYAKLSLGAGKFITIQNGPEFLEFDLLPLNLEDYRIGKPSATQIAVDFPEISLNPQVKYVNKMNIESIKIEEHKVLINFIEKIDFRASYNREDKLISIKIKNHSASLAKLNDIDIDRDRDGFVLTLESEKEIVYDSKRLDLENIVLFVKDSKLDLDGETRFEEDIEDGYTVKAKQDSLDVVKVDLNFKYGSLIKIDHDEERIVISVDYPNNNPDGKVVVIDPGHSVIKPGGWMDPGAISPYNRIKEKDVVLPIALRVEKELKDAGVNVIMTHRGSTYMDLYGRADLANRNNAFCFVSIHANATKNRAIQGIGTFYYAPEWIPEIYMQKVERKRLAELILEEALKETGRPRYGIFEKNLAVTRETRMPSVLVETGFLTNRTEERMLVDPDFQVKMAKGISKGILKFIEE